MKTAFFFDIDGTLYDNRLHVISDKTIKALKTLLEKNYPVYIVSSRSLHELSHLPRRFMDLPFHGWILEGGGLILNESRKPVQIHAMDQERMEKLSAYCRENQLGWRYACLENSYFGMPPAGEHRYIMNRFYLESPEYKPYEGEEVLNVLVWNGDPIKQKEILDIVKDASWVQYPDCMEIRSAKAGKENAVNAIRRKNRYNRIFCFGDGSNDADMLKAADTGVAMEDGDPVCLKAADAVIPSVREDGVWQYLKERGFI